MLILSRPARDINRKDEIDVDVGLIILKYCVSFEFCVVDSIPSLSRGHYFHIIDTPPDSSPFKSHCSTTRSKLGRSVARILQSIQWKDVAPHAPQPEARSRGQEEEEILL